jgi:hypothetical protein
MIKPLDEMTLGHRIALTFVIVLIILFALALAGWITDGWDESPAATATDLYEGIPLDADLIRIDHQALDQAYHNHLIKLWSVWLTDGAKDATHFRRGLMIARGAYKQAKVAILEREQQLKAR